MVKKIWNVFIIGCSLLFIGNCQSYYYYGVKHEKYYIPDDEFNLHCDKHWNFLKVEIEYNNSKINKDSTKIFVVTPEKNDTLKIDTDIKPLDRFTYFYNDSYKTINISVRYQIDSSGIVIHKVRGFKNLILKRYYRFFPMH